MTDGMRLGANTILVILTEHPGARACLDAASVAASVLDHPTIAGLHIRVDPMRDILPTEEILLPSQERAMEAETIEEGRVLHEVFSAWAAGLTDHIETSWLDIADGISDKVKELGSQAVLNVMANITSHSGGHARAAFHTCLFETSRPFLVVPSEYTPRKLSRILIGWKDTPPGRRVLEAALPWLRRAEAIRLTCIGYPAFPELKWAKEYLTDHRIAAEVIEVSRDAKMSIGEQLFHEARQFGADWLVTGAYWHNEYAEWILGGVTDTLLRYTTLPLFMSH